MAKNGKRFHISYCECPFCHHQLPIARIQHHDRKRHHAKDLWCPWCGKVVTTEEIRYNDAKYNLLGEKLDSWEEKK